MVILRLRVGMHYIIFWLLTLGPSLLASAMVPCTNEQLGALIPKAQRLSRDTLALYHNLNDCQQENIRDHALQWMSFYLVMTGDVEGPRKLEARVPRSAPSGIKQDIDNARHGDYSSLKRMIGASVSGYYDSALAQLALGRALMRDGKYDEAPAYYRNYLRLRPDDDLIAVELLYAYIWSGDLENAQSYFRTLTSYKTSPFLQLSLDNAAWLMSEAAKTPKATAAFAAPLSMGSMRFYLEEHKEDLGFERQSIGFMYSGAVLFTLARHRLLSTVYEGEPQGASEVNVAYQLPLSPAFILDGMAGYFAASSSRFYGRLALKGSRDAFAYETGYQIEPVALLYPMTANDLAVMRSSGYIKSSYQRWISFKASLAKDDFYSAFERYDLRLAAPLGQQSSEDASLDLVFPASYEHHPKAGAFSRSYPQSQSVGAGIALRHRLPRRLQTSLEATYHFIARNSFGEPSHTDFADRFVLDFGISYPWHDDLSFGLKGLYDIEKQEGHAGESWKTQGVLSWLEYSL